jgi:hypothetical protein
MQISVPKLDQIPSNFVPKVSQKEEKFDAEQKGI